MFQPPERIRVLEAAQLPEPDYTDISRLLATEHYDPDYDATWTADGVRAADSPNRRTAMKACGPGRDSVRKVSPVWDWRVRDVREALARFRRSTSGSAAASTAWT